MKSFALALLLSVASGTLRADDPQMLISGPGNYEVWGMDRANVWEVPVEGQMFSHALHIKTPSSAPNPWDLRVVMRPAVDAVRGHTALATFWVRSAASGQAFARFVVEQLSYPYQKSVEKFVVSGSDWQIIEVPFSFAGDLKPWEYSIELWISDGPQEIEFGGLSIVDYGADVPFSKLPLLVYPYQGHYPQAPWREEARRRIEQIRKTDLTISVRDASGSPVPNAAVHVKMKRHAFRFGSAVAAELINESSENASRYRDLIPKLFNAVVLENELKWPYWEFNPAAAQDAIKWLRSAGLNDIRGHNLIWPNWQYFPSDIGGLIGDQEKLRARVDTHIRSETTSLKGLITDWDVLNEPLDNTVLQNALGPDAMRSWFAAARESDPDARLYVNETAILSSEGGDVRHQNGYFALVRGLTDAGAPIDGIGIQAHFDGFLTPPARVWEILDRYASLGRDLVITEFDVSQPDESLQADYTRDFLLAAFAHPNVNGVFLWGFWEGRHWRPSAALFRNDWSIKPNGQAWSDLVFSEWWTDVVGETDQDGMFRTRAFLGDYDIEVGSGAEKVVIPARVSAGPTTISVKR